MTTIQNPVTVRDVLKMVPVPGTVPSSFDSKYTLEEQIMWLKRYLTDEVIPALNLNSQATADLIEYVENFFDNLDVQAEVDNKLDEMADAGTLQEIMAAYLNTRAVFAFDTVADMKASTNLENGSYARTLGFHSANDGGAALYKITNSGTANEMDIIAIGESLYAILVEPTVLTPEIFGAYGDDTHDDADYLQRMFDKHKPCKLTKHYKITKTVNVGGFYNVDIDAYASFITYTGSASALLLQNINGGNIKLGRVIAENGTCVKLYSTLGAADRIIYLNLFFAAMRSKDACIDAEATGTGWINELRVHGGMLTHGTYGFKFVNSCDAGFEGSNGIYCYNMGFEGTDNNYYFESQTHPMRGVILKDDRNVENAASIHLTLVGNFTGVDLNTWGRLRETRLDFSGATVLHNINVVCPILTSDGNATFADGLHYDINGRKTYTHTKRLNPTITKSSTVTSGNVIAHKTGNICYIQLSGITADSHSYDVVEAGNLPADFIPSDQNRGSSCVTLDGETARFYVTTSGKIQFVGNAAGHGKAFYGEVVYDPLLQNT